MLIYFTLSPDMPQLIPHPMHSSPTIVLLFLCALTWLGCSQDDCVGSETSIREYLIAKDSSEIVTYTEDSLAYFIVEPGDTARPTATSTITVNYTGYTTETAEQVIFDQSTGSPLEFPLDQLIEGWQQGIPLIGRGGKMRLYIPADLAYASNQAANLCPNSDLVFFVTLLDFE